MIIIHITKKIHRYFLLVLKISLETETVPFYLLLALTNHSMRCSFLLVFPPFSCQSILLLGSYNIHGTKSIE